MNWVIRHVDQRMYWSNPHGWIDFDHADRFSDEDKVAFNLPIDGEWVKDESPRLNEYAFDVELKAVIRVKAESRDEAERLAASALDCAGLSDGFIDGYNETNAEEGRTAEITEFSLSNDDMNLFEVNGKHVELDLHYCSVDELRDICACCLVEGEIWRPHVVADCDNPAPENGGFVKWYWYDRNDDRPTYHFGFNDERQALLDAIKVEGIDYDALEN